MQDSLGSLEWGCMIRYGVWNRDAGFPREFRMGMQDSLGNSKIPYSLKGCQISLGILFQDAKFPGGRIPCDTSILKCKPPVPGTSGVHIALFPWVMVYRHRSPRPFEHHKSVSSLRSRAITSLSPFLFLLTHWSACANGLEMGVHDSIEGTVIRTRLWIWTHSAVFSPNESHCLLSLLLCTQVYILFAHCLIWFCCLVLTPSPNTGLFTWTLKLVNS